MDGNQSSEKHGNCGSKPTVEFLVRQQTSFRIWRDLRAAFAVQLRNIASDDFQNLFAYRIPFLVGSGSTRTPHGMP